MAGKQNDYYKNLEKRICEEYRAGIDSFRDVAERLETNHKLVGRVLRRNGIEIRKAPPKPMSDVTKKKIGEKSKGRVAWNKGKSAKKTMTIKSRFENMRSHMRWNVDIDFLMKFDDFEKLKFLNKSISRKRDFGDVTTNHYKEFIEHFYKDKQFNSLYDNWLNNGEQKLLRPSIDHILPKSRGGSEELKNLQFLTWFENFSKRDMTQEEWENVKKNIGDYFV
jgi:5-methylcytosine-specific restriction endonuclease McrA